MALVNWRGLFFLHRPVLSNNNDLGFQMPYIFRGNGQLIISPAYHGNAGPSNMVDLFQGHGLRSIDTGKFFGRQLL